MFASADDEIPTITHNRRNINLREHADRNSPADRGIYRPGSTPRVSFGHDPEVFAAAKPVNNVAAPPANGVRHCIEIGPGS